MGDIYGMLSENPLSIIFIMGDIYVMLSENS